MKKIIKETIHYKDFNGDEYDIRFSDLPKDIQENDIIHVDREEAYFSPNESYNSSTRLIIFREREETDEEYQERISDNKYHNEELKKRGYENYLRLKSEFEPLT